MRKVIKLIRTFFFTYVQKKLSNFQTVSDTVKRFGSAETTLYSARLSRDMFIHPSYGLRVIDDSRVKSRLFPVKSAFHFASFSFSVTF
jgi:hypothetical protein